MLFVGNAHEFQAYQGNPHGFNAFPSMGFIYFEGNPQIPPFFFLLKS